MTPRALTLAIGATLILAANGVALTDVAYNRSGEPESRLTLSQRELVRPWDLRGNRENSGLALTLEWRVPDPDSDSYYAYYGNASGSPAWLDEKRMAELGFDVQRAKGDDFRGSKYISHSERKMLVVLELAGATWREVRERARQRVARQESLRQASPQTKELIAAEQRAREGLAREENENSRLFAVDAGTDLASLRSKYPDRHRYLILWGSVSLRSAIRDNKRVITGYLGRLSADQINVPHQLRGTFETMPPKTGGLGNKTPPFNVVIAVGQRLEPWIEAVATP